jgi:MFS transporter, FSR family, fosmidomycin resistance protein
VGLDRTRALAFTSLGHFVNDGSVFFVPVIVDLLSAVNGATFFESAVILSVFYLTSTLASIGVGRWADRAGIPARLMALGLALLGAGLVGFYFVAAFTSGTELFAFAVLSSMIMGFGSSFYHPLGGSILQATFGRGETGRALGTNGALGSVGRATYPTIYFVLIAPVLTKPGSLAFFGAVGVGAAVLIWMGLGKAESGTERKDAPQASVKSSLTKPMIMLLAVSFVRSAAFFGVAQYVPTFLTNERGLGLGPLEGLSLTAFFASAIVGQPLFGLLADRIDHRVVLTIATCGAAAAIVGYVNTGGWVSIALLSLFGFFAYTGFPLLMSLAADYSSQSGSAFGNSLVWGLGATGGNALGPLLIYAISLDDYARLGYSFEVMAALAVASAVGAMLIPKPKARPSS